MVIFISANETKMCIDNVVYFSMSDDSCKELFYVPWEIVVRQNCVENRVPQAKGFKHWYTPIIWVQIIQHIHYLHNILYMCGTEI